MQKITIMGVLNSTPDSFSDGGMYYDNTSAALARVQEMLEQGADWIDIGGESSRPGSESVPEEEQIRRVIPIIAAARKELGSQFHISVDTNRSKVAEAALDAGATIVNALNGCSSDPNLFTVVKKYSSKCIVYHIRGIPKTMQEGEITYENLLQEIADFFEQKIICAEREGVSRDQLILDPGIGFGKTVEHNLQILKNLHYFATFGLPLLIGVSRKGHLGSLLQRKLQLIQQPLPTERLEAALAETAVAVQHGATIIRTHDVLETKKFITVLEELL